MSISFFMRIAKLLGITAFFGALFSVVLFFVFDIFKIWGILSGRRYKKEAARFQGEQKERFAEAPCEPFSGQKAFEMKGAFETGLLQKTQFEKESEATALLSPSIDIREEKASFDTRKRRDTERIEVLQELFFSSWSPAERPTEPEKEVGYLGGYHEL